MKDTLPSKSVKPMSLKKLDDPASKDFWEFVHKSTQEWQDQQPSWSRELERERRADDRTEQPGQADRRVSRTR